FAVIATVALVAFVEVRGFQSGTAGPFVSITENTPYHIVRNWLDLDRQGRRQLVMASYVLLILSTGWIMWKHKLAEPADLCAAIGLQLALLIFIFAPNLRHWYQLWAFPFIALSGRRWLIAGAITFT